MSKTLRIARCACGSVEIEAEGAPIASTVCYCDDCQKGSSQLAALPGAGPVADADGGTAYVLYRKDRFKYTKGADLVQGCRIEETSKTSRVAATCCNAAMMMKFDDVRHWVGIYRARIADDVPPLEWRICTKFKPASTEIPNDVPSSAMYPPGFVVRLLASGIGRMLRL